MRKLSPAKTSHSASPGHMRINPHRNVASTERKIVTVLRSCWKAARRSRRTRRSSGAVRRGSREFLVKNLLVELNSRTAEYSR